MIKIVKNIKVYSPEFIGVKDVLIVGDKIGEISDSISFGNNSSVEFEIIDGTGKILVPGFIDNHVHILGGGGEGGFKTRTPEINLTDITVSGITTVIGCLGTDGITRNMASLLAKAYSLEEEGVSTYIYSGSYRLPVTTLTGDIMKDIIFIPKVIGAGEVAISDHRSSEPTIEDLEKLAADTRVAGILSSKSGVINMHIGNGKSTLKMLIDIVTTTEIPYSQFLPTHINRNQYLLKDGIDYAKAGGYIDFTTSTPANLREEGELSASKSLKRCIEEKVPMDRITFSSDGQGSLPIFNERNEFVGLGVGRVYSLYEEFKFSVLNENIPLEQALRVITINPAQIFKLKNKGEIKKSFDADMVLLDETTLDIDTVVAKGQIMVQDKKVKVYGTFQK